jgi:hypothetical protein
VYYTSESEHLAVLEQQMQRMQRIRETRELEDRKQRSRQRKSSIFEMIGLSPAKLSDSTGTDEDDAGTDSAAAVGAMVEHRKSPFSAGDEEVSGDEDDDDVSVKDVPTPREREREREREKERERERER